MKTSNSLTNKLVELRKQLTEKQKEISNEAKAVFDQESKLLFINFPTTLQNFSWTQYTPYWNDGETCVFHTNYVYSLKINEEDAEDVNDKIMHAEIIKFLQQFEDNDFLMMFDDHCKVTVNKDGVTVESYEHE